MYEQDSSQFADLVAGLGEIYNWHFSAAAIEIYWRLLESFRIEDVRTAIYRHMQNPDVGKFLPKPADIIMAIRGNSQDQAYSAWNKTAFVMRVIGGYSSVAFDDFLIHVAIRDMGNWIKICATDEKQMPFVAKEFQDRYRRYVINKPSSYPKYLMGRFELQNRTDGYSYPPPILIGNVLKVKEVIANGEDKSFLEIHTEETRTTKKVEKIVFSTSVARLAVRQNLQCSKTCSVARLAVQQDLQYSKTCGVATLGFKK